MKRKLTRIALQQLGSFLLVCMCYLPTETLVTARIWPNKPMVWVIVILAFIGFYAGGLLGAMAVWRQIDEELPLI